MSRETQKVWRAKNRDRVNAWARAYYAKNKDKIKAQAVAYKPGQRIWRGYPIPTRPETTHCELCGTDLRQQKQGACLDHCHDRHVFRGWLCRKCNWALGALGDRTETLQRAVIYLQASGDHGKG